MTKTALISVADKTGIVDFARRLSGLGIRLLSTGGTARCLRDADLSVIDVAQWTGFPEILNGRVKTLHPAIHAALLANRDNPEHLQTLKDHEIDPIDLAVVDLYPFGEVAADEERSLEEIVEEIDIGGVAIARAAAKNWAHTAVVTDRRDYDRVATAFETDTLGEPLRRELAARAFDLTASYDRTIADYLTSHNQSSTPDQISLELRRHKRLRYGENPHQEAALYHPAHRPDPAEVKQLHGKELSYNNLVDLDAALQLIWEFDLPAAAILKHTNPTGCATGDEIVACFERALAGDPISAFGGIVAVNRPIDEKAARAINEIFVEIVAAPGFDDEALPILKQKKNLRLIRWSTPAVPARAARSTSLGWLVQASDPPIELDLKSCTVPTTGEPNDEQWRDLALAWRIVKHVKSNAIVLVKDGQLIGVGAGQMSRVDAVRLAIERCVAASPKGAVLASDAFFPFRDGPDLAAEAGISVIVQPGGSRRDNEVIQACEEHSLAMVMTGMRHFRH